jgi:hypothetical protein
MEGHRIRFLDERELKRIIISQGMRKNDPSAFSLVIMIEKDHLGTTVDVEARCALYDGSISWPRYAWTNLVIFKSLYFRHLASAFTTQQ